MIPKHLASPRFASPSVSLRCDLLRASPPSHASPRRRRLADTALLACLLACCLAEPSRHEAGAAMPVSPRQLQASERSRRRPPTRLPGCYGDAERTSLRLSFTACHGPLAAALADCLAAPSRCKAGAAPRPGSAPRGTDARFTSNFGGTLRGDRWS